MKKFVLLSAASVILLLAMNSNSYSDLSNLNPLVAILKDDMPRLNKYTADVVAEQIAKTGMKTEFVTIEQLSSPDAFNADKFDLLVLTNGALNPIAIKKNLWNYLRYGGKMIVLGGPPFSDLCWKDNGRWVNMDTFTEQLSLREDKKVFSNFDEGNMTSDWKRETNNQGSASDMKLVSPGAANTRSALEIEIANLTGWDQFIMKVKPGVFPDEDAATCFLAKGDNGTGFLSVEWREEDGSRWLTMIKLSTEWQYYVLSPNDFRYWPDSKSKGRGFKGDRFNPLNAKELSYGLALDITPVGGGRHKFWVDEISTLSVGEYTKVSKEAIKPINYEILSPKYRLYEVSGISDLKKSPRQDIFPDIKWNLDGNMKGYLPINRITGESYVKSKRSRWIPIYDAYDQSGIKKGTAISMMLDWKRYKGAKWAYFSITDRDFYKNQDALDFIKIIALNMVTSPSLLTAGSDKYTILTRDAILLGAKIINPIKKTVNLSVKISVMKGASVVYSIEKSTTLAPMEEYSYDELWKPENKEAQYSVKTELTENGQVIDSLENELYVMENHQPIKAEDKFTVKNGKFYLGNTRWNPVGINYWPMYVSGMDPYDYYTGWLNPKFYDPIEIEKDLAMIQKMGLNLVSIQYTAREMGYPLMDFMRRCAKYKIKANIFVGYSDPMAGNFSKKTAREFISTAKIVNNPDVFAYDICWEPNMRTIEFRQEFDTEWNEWVDEQYGNKKNAIKEWKFSPRLVGTRKMFTAPSAEQVSKDGDWRNMVIAYRRFIDDMTSRKYNSGCKDLREIDPNHLLGGRSGYGGNGMAMPEWFPLDLFASAKHLDFISPEWYSLTMPEETLKAGFNSVYSYFVSNYKPVFWSEFGISVWDPISNGASPDILSKQARYYNNFINMCIKSGTQGLAAWWFPGGFRVDEKSDYGIFEQDRTPRPAVESLMKAVSLFKEESVPTTPKRFIKIDRYASCLGYYDVYRNARDEYLDAVDAGEFPGIMTEGTGTNSVNTPLIAIGNVPFNGTNPLKYLNSEFNIVRISKDKENWKEIKNGDTVVLDRNQPYYLSCSFGNTGEAEWIAPGDTLENMGKVYLSSTQDSQISIDQPIIRNVKYFEDGEIEPFILTGGVDKDGQKVTLRMTSKDRAQFGQIFRFTLAPKS